MQVVVFFIIYYVVIKMLLEHESTDQKIRRMDNDPNCSLKSDKWKHEHGEL